MYQNSIYIILPQPGNKPIGGFKIILDYANFISQQGYLVNIVYSAYVNRLRENIIIKLLRLALGRCRYIKGNICGYSCRNWFKLSENIKEELVFSPKHIHIQSADIIIATSATTLPYVRKFKTPNKFYFIQGYELWNCSESDLINTYFSDAKNLVISNWLHKLLASKGASSSIVLNGYDKTQFRVLIPANERNKYYICCMYHPSKEKGFEDAFHAIEIARNSFPQIRLTIFGAQKPKKRFPDWCSFFYQPTIDELNKIYNNSAIYVAASCNEGWGLTIGEAMMSGCAVVCTNNNGYLEMAINKTTAFVSEIGDINQMAQNIINLIQDDVLRANIVAESLNFISKFNIEDSRTLFYSEVINL